MPSQHIITTTRTRWEPPVLVRLPWRYLITGAYILSRGDNASFWHDASEDHRDRPVIKLTRARWRRVARRNAAITVPPALAVLDLHLAAAYLTALLLLAIAWGAVRSVGHLRERRRNREWIDPAAAVLCRVINTPYKRKRGRAMIDLPRGWGSGAELDAGRQSVRVRIPAGTPLSTGLKNQVTTNVGARLGIPGPLGEWREAGADVTVDILAAPVPPKEVTWDSLAKAVAEAAEDEIVLGRSSGGHIVSVSLSEDSPHIALSGPSGTGKSVLAKVALSQRVARGDGLIIMDPKKFSHWRWAGGGKLPRDRVIYAYRDEDLHEAWLSVAEEIRRRIELDEDQLEHERRVFVLAEEINVQTKKLTRYWKAERRRIMAEAKLLEGDADPADLDPPLQSPAIVAMQEAVAMGRELRMHVVAAAQRLSASVFGGNGGDIRESFQGGRLIAKWDRKLWKMLVDTIAYVACPVATRGVWGLARGEDFTIFRVPFMSDGQATELAMTGLANGPVLGRQDKPRVIEGGQKLSTILGQLPGQDGPSALSLEGLRTAAKRDGFPASVGQDGLAKLYDLDSVVAWRMDGLVTRR